MKKIFLLVVFFVSTVAFADPGVIIEAKGNVTINQAGKSSPATSGTQFADGSTIEVAGGGSATLMFSNGSIKKLNGGEKYTAAKTAAGQDSGTPLIKGIAMAYNDATKASKGPVVHGMVKAAPGQKVATKSDFPLTPERKKEMQADLNKVNTLGLGVDGKALMQAQVYYKYQQYQKTTSTLLPIYKNQHPPADMVKNLLATSYEKMGKADEAAKYRK